MKYQRYAAYKDSGVEWLGDVPEHWDIVRLKNILQCRITDGPHTTPVFVDEGVPFLSVDGIQDGELKFEGCRYISESSHAEYRIKALPKKDDLLMGKAASTGKIARVKVDFEFSIWSPLALIRLDSTVSNPTFFEQSLKSPIAQAQIENLCTANTQKNISMDDIPKLILTRPPLEEQQKIANFLDHETAKIDTLIEKQRRLIELLKEKRQAVISHAVTKGLNPNAPMKDSGVEWLGEVPEHWRVCAIKHQLSSLDFKRIPLSAEERGSRSGEFRYYGASGVIDYIDDYIFDESTVLVGEDGANLVNRSTPLAFSAHGKYWVNNHAHILKSDDGLADYWAETIEHIDINPLVSGSAQPKLTAENLNNLKIAFPPSAEERIEINNFISEIKSKFDFLMSKAKQQIELLQERRTALISAAVTGKIDVRQWQKM